MIRTLAGAVLAALGSIPAAAAAVAGTLTALTLAALDRRRPADRLTYVPTIPPRAVDGQPLTAAEARTFAAITHDYNRGTHDPR